MNGANEVYYVSIVSGDPVTKEVKAGQPVNNGSISVYLDRDAVEGPVTVGYTIATGQGYATNGVDYAAIPTSVTIPQGGDHYDIPINVINDLKVEGDELVLLALEASPTGDYEFGDYPQGDATIHDNDHWEWVDPTGTPLDVDFDDTRVMLPDYDGGPLDDPAYAYITAGASAEQNSASANLYGFFFEPHMYPTEDEEHRIDDDVVVDCEFDETTGDIGCNASGGVDATGPVESGDLKGKIGFEYQIDNSGDLEHTCQVKFSIVAVVDGTITVEEGFEGGYESEDGLQGQIGVTITHQGSKGDKWKYDREFTLKLKAVEND